MDGLSSDVIRLADLRLFNVLPPGVVIAHLELEVVRLSRDVITSSADASFTLPGFSGLSFSSVTELLVSISIDGETSRDGLSLLTLPVVFVHVNTNNISVDLVLLALTSGGRSFTFSTSESHAGTVAERHLHVTPVASVSNGRVARIKFSHNALRLGDRLCGFSSLGIFLTNDFSEPAFGRHHLNGSRSGSDGNDGNNNSVGISGETSGANVKLKEISLATSIISEALELSASFDNVCGSSPFLRCVQSFRTEKGSPS